MILSFKIFRLYINYAIYKGPFSTFIELFYIPVYFKYSRARYKPDPFSTWPLQRPSKHGPNKGSKWKPGPLNTL